MLSPQPLSGSSESHSSPDDAALLQNLKELEQQTDTTRPMEALLEVSAFDGTNLTGKLLLESNRDRAATRQN
jgi:hypothetical protein